MQRNRSAIVLATILMFCTTADASGYTFGTADSPAATPAQLAASAALGARVSRILIDVDRPLSDYDQAVAARQTAGMRVQVVIGGLYAGRRAPTIQEAVAVHRRWPDLFSISVVNEPEGAGWTDKLCSLRRQFGRIYRALKREGVPLVLFGEWSPHLTLTLTRSVMFCGPVVADGFAWHAYEFSTSWDGRITNLSRIRAFLAASRPRLHTPRGLPLPMFITEYGQATRGKWAVDESLAAFRWRRAMTLATRYNVAELVAYAVHEAPVSSEWDSSLIDTAGKARQAATAIAAAR